MNEDTTVELQEEILDTTEDLADEQSFEDEDDDDEDDEDDDDEDDEESDEDDIEGL